VSDQQNHDADPDFRPVEEEGVEQESAPRRDKSAEFTVTEQAGADVEMRRAMDPANQSLADALRLSYRILQLAIFGLAIVFLFSGFQTVAENYTGVRTLFGAIEGEGEDAQLAPGLQPFWPYPVGEIITVPMRRAVRVDHAFWPKLASSELTINQATDSAAVTTPLRPGVDGSLMLRNGDLAHAKIEAEYEIEDAVEYLDQFSAEEADRVVGFALQRATVQVAAASTLDWFLENREESSEEIGRVAQETLDQIESGIRLVSVSLPERLPPLAVRKAVQGVQTAREQAKTAVEVARGDVQATQDGAAGPAAYVDLTRLIDEYELALSSGDLDQAELALDEVNQRFEQDDVSGDAAAVISKARAYRSMIESTLGNDARRLAGLLPAYRENPSQLVRQLWLDAYRDVLAGPEVEVFSAPPGMGSLALRLSSSQDIATARRDAQVERRKAEAAKGLVDRDRWQLGSRQITIGKPGRRLNREASGGYGREE
jgi:membrane protease subunit HflK